MQDFHSIGGTTVLQFGPRLMRHADPAEVAVGCQTMSGGSCVQEAVQDIGQSRIRNWLTYSFNEHYGDAIACPSGLDKKIEATVNGVQKVFWRIVLPHDGQAPCDYSWGGFDVLFVEYEKNATESVTAMLTVADHLAMEAYLGAPALPVVEGKEWMIDTAMLPSHRNWARRVYSDWQARHSAHASFRGMYQSYELLLGSTYATPYEEYAIDAAAFHDKMPAGKYMISPYLFLFKDGTSNTRTVASTVDSFRTLAESGVDIVAPQAGRGTGKGAHYWAFQETTLVKVVDPILGNYPQIDAEGSFAGQFTASARDAFNGMRTMQQQLNEAGSNVALWANLEAFEQDTESANFAKCNYDQVLSQTTKARMDRALTFLGGRVDRVISYMYDPLFTCTNRGPSLLESIRADHDRPIVTGTFFWDSPSQGLVIHGHGIAANTSFRLTWYNAGWQGQSQTVSPGWVFPGGAGGGLDSVWLPFSRSDLAPSFYVHVQAIKNTPSGQKVAIETYRLKY